MAKKRRRDRGTGCLVRRGNVWYARWVHDGEAHSISTHIHVDERGAKKRAEEFLMDLTEPLRIRNRIMALEFVKRQIQKQTERLADDAKRMQHGMTLGELPDAFRRSQRRLDCSKAMLNEYCRVALTYARFAGKSVPVAAIGGDEAEEYARHISSRLSPNTFNKTMNALSLVWRACVRGSGGAPVPNPWDSIARKKLDTHVRRVFTREETDLIMERAQGEMKTLVAVMLYTGLRLGDACRLKISDVKDGIIYVTTSKRDKKVAIPLHPRLAEALKEASPSRDGYFMPDMAAKYASGRVGASAVSNKIKVFLESCGIVTAKESATGRKRPDASAHSFRHTFVTRAVESGVPQYAVQAIVGHSSAAMTEHYTHISDKMVIEAFSKME